MLPKASDVQLTEANSLLCRPAPCGFQTRMNVHLTEAEQEQKSTDLSIYMLLQTGLRERNYNSVFSHIHLFLRTNDLVCARVRIISVLGTLFSYDISNYNKSVLRNKISKRTLCALLQLSSNLLLILNVQKKPLFS